MKRIAAATAIGVTAVCVFWRTVFPSITWWDSSSYSLAAATFGVSSSPGSLLLMLLGWPIAHLPFGNSPAYRLNLLAGVLAAITSAIVYFAALRVLRSSNLHAPSKHADNVAPGVGAAAGALAFAFGSTTWEHAVMFTPYILTAAFTAALLYVLVRWWEEAERPDSPKWLALTGLLFGLDFSVHRTNALLIPGALLFVMMRNPRTVTELRTILVSAGGLVAGLSVQLLLIPVARFTNSDLNFGNPRDFSRLLDYVSLSQSGGSFLVKIFPRNSDVWHVQIRDFLSTLGDNALRWNGVSGVAGTLPAVAAVWGLIAIGRRSLRLAFALLTLMLAQASMTVFFFNIPANYFRSLDRHYLPVWVTVGLFMACGLGAAGQWIGTVRFKRRLLAWVTAALLLAVPGVQLLDNWRTHDASKQYFAHDYAVGALKALPPNAIYFTVGDNDTFPLMYMQAAEHVRPDVRIVNLSVTNYDDYPDQRHEHDPTFPISILSAERRAIAARPWTDTLLLLPFAGDNATFGLQPSATTLSTGVFTLKPQWSKQMTLGEITLIDIVRTNAWRRPLTFSITATHSGMTWLDPYARLEGMYWRIVPLTRPAVNAEVLRRNLLANYSYRGYADSTVIVDDVATRIGVMYYDVLEELAAYDRARGDTASCRIAVAKFAAAVPLARLVPRPVIARPSMPECDVTR